MIRHPFPRGFSMLFTVNTRWQMVMYYPIGSMYAIYGDIYHQYTPVMLAYIPYMDPMGILIHSQYLVVC